jgi:homoserine kinase
MIISAPASTANLGPGFDTLGLALDVHFSLALNEQPRGGSWEPANDTHPAIISYREAGGVTELSRIWTQSHIPYARGMGFSGAARVAGAFAAFTQNGMTETDARDHSFRIAGDLEGHDDNAAPSAYGGFCVTTSGHVMRFDCEPHLQDLALLMFTPEVTTSTKESRGTIPTEFSKEDLVASIGNVAMLTAMLASNTFNDDVLKIVTNDVIHQPTRFDACAESRAAYDAFKDSGAIAQWLSGSGPSVTAIVDVSKKEDIVAQIEKLELGCAFSCTEVVVSQEGVHETQA